jgi:DNA polymerase-1
MMLRGVRSDDTRRAELSRELAARLAELQAEVDTIRGAPINIRSPKQMADLFYTELAQSPIYRLVKGKRAGLTTDDDALIKIGDREPLLRPFCERIQAMRSIGVFRSTFVEMRRDIDGRLRTSYNVAGTITYRFSSSENAFGSGGNLQNIPSGDEEDDATVPLPNIRKLFLFDEDRIGFDLDGDSADLRIVTGEAGCRQMQAYFAAGAKPYVEIAKEFYHDPTITKSHPSYKRMKALCHATNYLGQPAGLSKRIGLPVKDVERMQRWYFGMCPEIAAWQKDIIAQIEGRGWIENPFGYRCWFVDRISQKSYGEGIAWIPQSSVAIFINKILVALDAAEQAGELPVELLLQVHDSLTGQWPSALGMGVADEIKSRSRVPIPCRTGEIIIPVGLKTSTVSWGDCS